MIACWGGGALSASLLREMIAMSQREEHMLLICDFAAACDVY